MSLDNNQNAPFYYILCILCFFFHCSIFDATWEASWQDLSQCLTLVPLHKGFAWKRQRNHKMVLAFTTQKRKRKQPLMNEWSKLNLSCAFKKIDSTDWCSALYLSRMRLPLIIIMWFSFVFCHFFRIASWHHCSADYKANISFSTRPEKILCNRIRLYLKERIYFWAEWLPSGVFPNLNTVKLTIFNSLNGQHHNWSIKHLKLNK